MKANELVKNADISQDYWIDELNLDNILSNKRALGFVEAKISELHESESSCNNEYFRERIIEWLSFFI